MPQAAQLMGAGMLYGPPEESGYLVPDQNKGVTQGNRRIWTQRWKFDQPHWYPTFAYCAYDGGAIQLFRPIPKEAKECSLAGRKKGGVVEEATFVCK